MDKLEFFNRSSHGRLTTPEIDSHRPYAQGEDPRYIDWNLYARMDRFFLKTVVSEEEGILHLIIDTSASMRKPHSSKHRCSLEIGAGIAYLLLASGNRLAIHSGSDRILQTRFFLRGEKDTRALLHHLSKPFPGERTDLGMVLSNLEAMQREQNVRTILISDLIDLKGYISQIGLVQARNVRIGAIQVLHPREVTPHFRGNTRFIDPETGEMRKLLVGYRMLRTLRQTAQRFHEQTSAAFQQQRVPFLRASTQMPFEKSVIDFMSDPCWRGKG